MKYMLFAVFLCIFGANLGQDIKNLTIWEYDYLVEQLSFLNKQLNDQNSIINLQTSMLSDRISNLNTRFDRLQTDNINLNKQLNLNPFYACLNPEKHDFKKESNGKYYKIGDLLLNWLQGEEYCQKYGAHLPSVSNKRESDLLRDLIHDRVSKIPMYFQALNATHESGFLLGGYRYPNDKNWRWTDGSAFEYKQFGENEPNDKEANEYYLHDYYSLGNWIDWNDVDNLAYMHVICQLNC